MNLVSMAQMLQRQVKANGALVPWSARAGTNNSAQGWKGAANIAPVVTDVTAMFVLGRHTDMYALLHLQRDSDVPMGDLYAYVIGPPDWIPDEGATVLYLSKTYNVQAVTPIAPNAVLMVYYVSFGA
jgi:hypothetical protein